MSDNLNLKLWASVCKTPPSYTKHVAQRGGYTAIDPTHQAQRATEVFGPYGIGWGLKESDFDYTLVEQTGMVTHKAKFFFILDGKEGSFPIHNAVSIWGDKNRTRPDEDFAKKVETNTISKSLSRLGFNADVFLGKFDDLEYVANAKNEEQLAVASNKEAELERQKRELGEWAERELKSYPLIPNEPALRNVLKGHLRKLEERCLSLKLNYNKAKVPFDNAFSAQLEVINQQHTGS